MRFSSTGEFADRHGERVVAGRPARLPAARIVVEKGSGMNVLLLGSGGREHALAWKLAQSPAASIRSMPRRATPGSREHADAASTLDATDHAAVIAFCARHDVGLVVIGPEAPLVDGLADSLRAARHRRVRAERGGGAARGIEGLHQGSVRARRHPDRGLCPRAPTPRRGACAALDDFGLPVVIKADGLAAGKGVTVASTAPKPRPRSTRSSPTRARRR